MLSRPICCSLHPMTVLTHYRWSSEPSSCTCWTLICIQLKLIGQCFVCRLSLPHRRSLVLVLLFISFSVKRAPEKWNPGPLDRPTSKSGHRHCYLLYISLAAKCTHSTERQTSHSVGQMHLSFCSFVCSPLHWMSAREWALFSPCASDDAR